MRKVFFSITFLLSVCAIAQERILDFQSTVTVNPDRSVTVTEIIKVKVEGINIKRGIYRDIITVMVNERGQRRRLKLEVTEVLRDGKREEFVTQESNNVNRIRIGNADVFLNSGVYTYTIRYTLEKQVRFFDTYDEVYWNATGNDWQFPIEKASIQVVLPEGAIIKQHAGYSGSTGETGCRCAFVINGDNRITYSTTEPLMPYQGLTVAVGWQKGIIAPPTQAELDEEAFNDKKGIYYGTAGLLILATYLLVAWFIVGRDPKKESIIPRFEPPHGFSPAACRYVLRMGFDNKAFTASLINMAVKGFLVIDKTGDDYVLRKVSDKVDNLSADEKEIASKLFKSKKTVSLDGSYDSELSGSITKLKDSLRVNFLKMNFRKNGGWMVPAILLGIATWAYVLVFVSDDEQLLVPLIAGSFIFLFAVGVLAAVVANFRKASGFRKIVAFIPAFFVLSFVLGIPTVFFTSLTLDESKGLDVFTEYAPYAAIFIGIVFLIFLFFYLIQAPTVFGRKRMDEIEGLRLFMKVAEKDRLNMLNPPEKTPQLFERLLPFAIALNVENAWGRQFDAIIKKAIENKEYTPTWYAGDSRSIFSVNNISTGLGSSMSSAISSSSTPPSSSGSSGSSGGGFSGGGGGGGGGGGW